jgi:exonuclease SbcD
MDLLAQALDDPDCARAIENAIAPLTAKLPADIVDPDTAPLLASARMRDGAALVRAARALVEARLGEGAH